MYHMPEHIAWYLAGFADGEGSFNVSFRRRSDYNQPWKISLCFNISQKDRVILALCKRYLGCGTIRGRPDGVWYYEVNNLSAIVETIIPFFRRYSFLSAKKKRDFSKFCQIAQLMKTNQHLQEQGVRHILEIRREMNDGGKRKYTEQDILRTYRESSETIRRTPMHIGDDIVRSA
jgi:intein-encoded DNA endonuclease-like protein